MFEETLKKEGEGAMKARRYLAHIWKAVTELVEPLANISANMSRVHSSDSDIFSEYVLCLQHQSGSDEDFGIKHCQEEDRHGRCLKKQLWNTLLSYKNGDDNGCYTITSLSDVYSIVRPVPIENVSPSVWRSSPPSNTILHSFDVY